MNRARQFFRSVSRRRFDRSAVTARHSEPSAISSVDDLEPKPTDALIALALEAVRIAAESPSPRVWERCSAEAARYVETWPGEHYRLLPALARAVEATTVIEVGTFTGLGALSLTDSGARVVTYDVVPWNNIPGTVLVEEDLSSIDPRLGDLADPDFFEEQLPTLSAAGLLFVDGPKDGKFEPAFARNVEAPIGVGPTPGIR